MNVDNLELEYLKLQPGNQTIKRRNVCNVCEREDCTLIECRGSCQSSFHLDCVGLLSIESSSSSSSLITNFKCDECTSNLHTCFMCKKRPTKAQQETKRCSIASCGKYYHDECIKSSDLFRKENLTGTAAVSITCPLHTCKTCYSHAMLGEQAHRDTLLSQATKGLLFFFFCWMKTNKQTKNKNQKKNYKEEIRIHSSYDVFFFILFKQKFPNQTK